MPGFKSAVHRAYLTVPRLKKEADAQADVLPKQNARACARFGTFDAIGMRSPSNRPRQYRNGSMMPALIARKGMAAHRFPRHALKSRESRVAVIPEYDRTTIDKAIDLIPVGSDRRVHSYYSLR
jgi:hypothetical protein